MTEGFDRIVAAVAGMEEAARSFSDECRIVFLRNITIEGIDTLLTRNLYAERIRPIVQFGGYGTMVQDVLAADGAAGSDADLIVLALSVDELDASYGSPGWTSHAASAQLEGLFELLASRTRATIAVHSFIGPLWSEQGLIVAAEDRDLTSQTAALNRLVVEAVRRHSPRFVLMDWERYLRRLGAESALDPRGHYLWRAPFKRAFLEVWAQQLARVVCALRGRAKKVLVLDCDNTLWGGVIGEDGLDGIQLDRHQYPGRAFFDFQTTIRQLAARGVLIALCSKNNEAEALDVIDHHPACQLRRADLAAWRINWNDKASNLSALAAELNLGLDSFVFVDDSALECELIRQLLPQVTVMEVPRKLHELPPLLLRDGLFDTLSVTGEDSRRTRLYQDQRQREQLRSAVHSIEDYLRSLETVARIHRADNGEVPRIAQLTQKTNQFNLTTRRYSEQDIRAFIADEDVEVFSLTARDRFDSLGLVGVLVVFIEGTEARVDSFLLSCRALGRRLELAMIARCLAKLREQRGIEISRAEYLPTARNAQVADFWPSVGFSVTGTADGGTRYMRLIDGHAGGTPTFVTIEDD